MSFSGCRSPAHLACAGVNGPTPGACRGYPEINPLLVIPRLDRGIQKNAVIPAQAGIQKLKFCGVNDIKCQG
jgi:hypothetical protein